MGTAFNSEQFNSIYPEGIENHYWNKARNMILEKTLNDLNSKANILEIGCGKGIVCEYLRNKGFEIHGIELAEVPVKDSLMNYIETGRDVFDLPEDFSSKIKTILLLDVIEHIEFPSDFIKNLNDKFPNLKNFIVTVPARQEIFTNHDEFNGHFRRYDIKELKNEFHRLKIKSTRISYLFHLLYLPALFIKLAGGNRPEKIIAPSTKFQLFFHRILSWLFYWEYAVVPSRLFGSSLLIQIELECQEK